MTSAEAAEVSEATDARARGGGEVRSNIYFLDEDFSGNLSLPEKSPKTGYVSKVNSTICLISLVCESVGRLVNRLVGLFVVSGTLVL